MNDPIGVAIIGYGFMGRTHEDVYRRAARDGFPCRIAAVCDPAPAARGPVGPPPPPPQDNDLVPSLDALLEDPGVRLVSVCTPTHTHVDIASRALRADKHVLLEKPVSLDPDEIEPLASLAGERGLLCMPAMCIRFWPAWRFIADAIGNGRFGRIHRVAIRRLGSLPDWSSFYADRTLSGGPLFDLHIHDTDFIVHALGTPTAIETTGDELHFTTRYTIPDHDAHITAEGSWAQTPGEGFVMRCTVECAEATLDFDLGRARELVVTRNGVDSSPSLPDLNGYHMEVRAMLTAIADGASQPPVTLAEAAAVTRILHAERRSLATGRAVTL
jgi:predicted dehydrogenase